MSRSLLNQIFKSQDGQPQTNLSSRISSMKPELQSPNGLGVEFVEEPTIQYRAPVQTQPTYQPSYQAAHVASDEQNELVHRLNLEISRMKKQIQELESKAQTTDVRYNEIVASQKKIFDRVQSALQLFDERLKSVCQDLASRFSVLRGKMTEQKGYETKVEELLDRHNSLVHGFENRMDNMSRVIKEQEMQLLTFKSLFQQLSQRK